jgi:hypothetical protein
MKLKQEYHNQCRECSKLFWTKLAFRIFCNQCLEHLNMKEKYELDSR